MSNNIQLQKSSPDFYHLEIVRSVLLQTGAVTLLDLSENNIPMHTFWNSTKGKLEAEGMVLVNVVGLGYALDGDGSGHYDERVRAKFAAQLRELYPNPDYTKVGVNGEEMFIPDFQIYGTGHLYPCFLKDKLGNEVIIFLTKPLQVLFLMKFIENKGYIDDAALEDTSENLEAGYPNFFKKYPDIQLTQINTIARNINRMISEAFVEDQLDPIYPSIAARNNQVGYSLGASHLPRENHILTYLDWDFLNYLSKYDAYDHGYLFRNIKVGGNFYRMHFVNFKFLRRLKKFEQGVPFDIHESKGVLLFLEINGEKFLVETTQNVFDAFYRSFNPDELIIDTSTEKSFTDAIDSFFKSLHHYGLRLKDAEHKTYSKRQVSFPELEGIPQNENIESEM